MNTEMSTGIEIPGYVQFIQAVTTHPEAQWDRKVWDLAAVKTPKGYTFRATIPQWTVTYDTHEQQWFVAFENSRLLLTGRGKTLQTALRAMVAIG